MCEVMRASEAGKVSTVSLVTASEAAASDEVPACSSSSDFFDLKKRLITPVFLRRLGDSLLAGIGGVGSSENVWLRASSSSLTLWKDAEARELSSAISYTKSRT